jgi:TRAP-type C4-dicarboxylate transport system substrate-binding protein
MMGNPLFVDTMNAMGGNGIAMGLRRGVQRAADRRGRRCREQPAHAVHGQPLHRRAKFYAQTNHLIIPEIFVMSKVTWDKLSKDDQALVKKFAREAQMEQRGCGTRAWPTTPPSSRPQASSSSTVDKKPFFDATAPVRAKYGAQFADLMKRIEAVK